MKTTDEIYNEMLAAFAEKTDYTLSNSCDLAVRMYAAAAQINALYTQSDYVSRQCFPQTAEGIYLDYHADMRGIERAAACKAAGKIRFSLSAAIGSDVKISKGTVCMTGIGESFETTEDAVIAAGETYADIPASAQNVGTAGNAEAGSITKMSVAPTSVAGCTNVEAFSGGSDEETDAALRVRILDSFLHLPNGANSAYYRREALNNPEVAEACVVPRARGNGTVDVYIASNSGLPDSALVAKLQAELEQRREISVDLKVLAPTTHTVNITAAVTVAEGAEFDKVKTEIDKALRAYFGGELLGSPVYLAKLGSIIYGVDGVENYTLALPTSDCAGDVAVLPVLGTLVLEEAE